MSQEPKPLTIVELTASNVKRLKAVHITPHGAAVVLGGKNGQGKSSVLDAIAMALGGLNQAPPVPVRRGEEKAEILVDLGEILVKRTFTAAGGTALVVTNRDGARFPSPQAMLDKLTGALTFDPLAFSRMAPQAQAETLRKMLGLDFADMVQERAALYGTRTDMNRDLKALEARLAAMPHHPDAPWETLPSLPILEEQEAAVAKHRAAVSAVNDANRENDAVRARAHLAAQDAVLRAKALDHARAAEHVTREEIARQQAILAGQEAATALRAKEAQDAQSHAAALAEKARALTDTVPPFPPDMSGFRARLEALEIANGKVRANAARAKVAEGVDVLRRGSEELTAKIEALDARREAEIAAAKMPVPGLAFDASGVTLDGLPFEQASQAQQLRVSVAMGFAMNPRLRILLIRDASLLDAESLALVEQMAADAGAQVWLERVEQDGATTVLIEDGSATEVNKE